jgi:hypothetical protein
MAEPLESSRSRPGGVANAELRTSVERWFLQHGLPHFVPRYRIRLGGRVPVLLLLLFVVLAFELSVEPWLELTGLVLLLAPAVVIVLTWWVAPACAPALGVDWQPRPGPLSVWLRLTTAFAALDLLVLRHVPLDAIVDFLVIFVALWASALMYRPGLWSRCDTGRQDPLAIALMVLLAVGVVAFAFEGNLLPDFDPGVEATAGAVLPGLRPLPHAVPAVPIVLAILLLALKLGGAERPATPRAATGTMSVFAPVAPVLVLVLGGESTVLAEALDGAWLQAALPLVLVGLAVVASMAHAVRARSGQSASPQGGAPARIKDTITEPSRAGLMLWITSYLLVFPVLFGIFADVRLGGHELRGIQAFAFALAINALYLGIVWTITSFGIDHVASWAAAEARTNLANVVAGIARGLPLLLIVTAFSVLSADVWEAVAGMQLGAYVGLIALILGATVTFALLNAKQELDEARTFGTWPEVQHELDEAPPQPGDTADAPAMCLQLHEALQESTLSHASLHSPLGARRWINAVAVLAVYQAFIFVPLMIAGTALFWIIGRLAVRSPVASAWIYGDGSSPALAKALTTRPFFEQPWTRVALLLGAFSLLYVVIQVLSSKDQRREFFRGADAALRLRFALLLAYDAVFANANQRTSPPKTAPDVQRFRFAMRKPRLDTQPMRD